MSLTEYLRLVIVVIGLLDTTRYSVAKASFDARDGKFRTTMSKIKRLTASNFQSQSIFD